MQGVERSCSKPRQRDQPAIVRPTGAPGAPSRGRSGACAGRRRPPRPIPAIVDPLQPACCRWTPTKTFVGPNGTYYDERWRWMEWRGRSRSWNWSAALTFGGWLAYRRLYASRRALSGLARPAAGAGAERRRRWAPGGAWRWSSRGRRPLRQHALHAALPADGLEGRAAARGPRRRGWRRSPSRGRGRPPRGLDHGAGRARPRRRC